MEEFQPGLEFRIFHPDNLDEMFRRYIGGTRVKQNAGKSYFFTLIFCGKLRLSSI